MIHRLKRSCLCLLAAVLLLGWGPAASAETFYGGSDWQVTFTDKIEENFLPNQITDVLRGLQPDDNAIITIKLMNTNVQTTDWYMKNDVISSLEDGSSVAKGGAYTYKLTYKNKSGQEKVLFDSETVGGENAGSAGEGLHGATGALKDFFYLDTLKTNESGAVTLEVALDGETQTNDYQNTLADVQINFAVELGSSRTQNTNRTQVVRTGDETRLLPLYIAMAVSGLLLLGLGIYSLRRDRKNRRRRGE